MERSVRIQTNGQDGDVQFSWCLVYSSSLLNGFVVIFADQ